MALQKPKALATRLRPSLLAATFRPSITGGAVTPIAVGITVNGVVVPDSVAIVTPAAVGDYWHVNTTTSVTVPCGCCVTVSGTYVDGTEDDPATTPTPSIQVRRKASLDVDRIA